MSCRAYVAITPSKSVEAICRDCGATEAFDPAPFVRKKSYEAALEWTRLHNRERATHG